MLYIAWRMEVGQGPYEDEKLVNVSFIEKL